MGVRVIALKTLRRDLANHLASAMSATAPLLGAQVHPPAVVVQPAPEYLAAQDYCTDAITFQAVLITKPGDLAAEVDALDDMVDKVRTALRTATDAGNRFTFQGVSGRVAFDAGDREFPSGLPAVVATIRFERTH